VRGWGAKGYHKVRGWSPRSPQSKGVDMELISFGYLAVILGGIVLGLIGIKLVTD